MKRENLIIISLLISLGLFGLTANSQQPNPPGQVKEGEIPVNEAYLFAHKIGRAHV